MTVGILDSQGHISEYWFKNGIADTDLIPKIPEGSGLPSWMKVARFSPNGGSGHMNSVLSDDEGYVKLPECTFTNQSEFRGWGLTNAAQEPFIAGDEIRLDSEVTRFFAIWEGASTRTITYDETVISCTCEGVTIQSGASVADGSTVVFTYERNNPNIEFRQWNGFRDTDNATYTYAPNPITATVPSVSRDMEIGCSEDTFYTLSVNGTRSHGTLALTVDGTQTTLQQQNRIRQGAIVLLTYTYNTGEDNWSIGEWNCNGASPTVDTHTELSFIMPGGNVSVTPKEYEEFVISFYWNNEGESVTLIEELNQYGPITFGEIMATTDLADFALNHNCDTWFYRYSSTVAQDIDVIETTTSFVCQRVGQRYEVLTSANPTAGGTVSGGGFFIANRTVTLTATPKTEDGYRFVEWRKFAVHVSDNPVYSFTMSANGAEGGTYNAYFAKNQYQITVSANPSDGGTVSGGGWYTPNQYTTITATPNQGYTFVNWTKDGAEVSTSASYYFEVASDGDYVANFEAEAPFTVQAVGLSGAEKYADWIQNTIDDDAYTVTDPMNITLDTPTTVTIRRETGKQGNIQGYTLLLPYGYEVASGSVAFFDSSDRQYDPSDVHLWYNLEKDEDNPQTQETYTYNGIAYYGYVMYTTDYDTPSKVRFTVSEKQ